ncbi:MAG: DUF4468 domain-containing protein [Bacteroidaceae bacterium]|nr:DUF4468 domain-containing protein [Bacteroidaceae bacterium]
MKKIVLSMFMLLALTATAKDKTSDAKYLAGAVPEENGTIVFRKGFSVAGKSDQEVTKVMQDFVNQLVDKSITAPGNYARIMESSDNSVVARVCEWLVFKQKPFVSDKARMRYLIQVNTKDSRVDMSVTQISYYYEEDQEGMNGEIIKAEEWISDKEALNKAKTKLYPKSGKFRRKTVDRMENLFEAAMDAFDEPEPEVVVPVKKVRKNIVED